MLFWTHSVVQGEHLLIRGPRRLSRRAVWRRFHLANSACHFEHHWSEAFGCVARSVSLMVLKGRGARNCLINATSRLFGQQSSWRLLCFVCSKPHCQHTYFSGPFSVIFLILSSSSLEKIENSSSVVEHLENDLQTLRERLQITCSEVKLSGPFLFLKRLVILLIDRLSDCRTASNVPIKVKERLKKAEQTMNWMILSLFIHSSAYLRGLS